MGKPRGSFTEASPSRGSPTFLFDPCEPIRSVSRGVLSVTPSRSVEPKPYRSGSASPAPGGRPKLLPVAPRGCRPALTVPLRRSPEAVVRPGAEAPFRAVKPPRGDSGSLVGESLSASPAGGWPGVNPVSNWFPSEPSGPTTAPILSEPRLLQGASPAFRPSRLVLRDRGLFEPGDRLSAVSVPPNRSAEAGLSAPPARTEVPAEGAQRYDALLAGVKPDRFLVFAFLKDFSRGAPETFWSAPSSQSTTRTTLLSFLSQGRGTLQLMSSSKSTTELEPVAPPLLETLSPSRAGDFKHCPQLFKFKAIDKIETPPTVYQARGTTAHLALQRLFDESPELRTPERLYDLFRQAWLELKDEEFSETLH